MFNQEQNLAIVRAVLQIAGTFIVTSTALGIDAVAWQTIAGSVEAISGAVLVMVPLVWTLLSKRKASMIKTVAEMPEIERVVVVSTPAGEALAKNITASKAVVTIETNKEVK